MTGGKQYVVINSGKGLYTPGDLGVGSELIAFTVPGATVPTTPVPTTPVPTTPVPTINGAIILRSYSPSVGAIMALLYFVILHLL